MEEKIVYIRRVEGSDRTRLPKDMLDDAKRPIGASFDQFGQILKGVTGEEERFLMPQIIGISKDDPAFNKRIEEFWANITIRVSPGTGTMITLTKDENGNPTAPLDYVKYKFALKHKHVCMSEKELENYPKALFYIYDPNEEREIKLGQLKIRNEAKLKYLELIQDDEKLDAVITIFTEHKNISNLTPDEKQLIIEEKHQKDPVKFLAILEDKNLLMKSFIYRAIFAGVFKQSGARIIFENDIIGEDMESAVIFLNSKEGSKYYVSAEGRLNEWLLSK